MAEMSESSTKDPEHCAHHVQAYDPDRYLCTMFAPVSARRSLMSLYAFNSELAMVRERVNEPILGEMRFQWWRDQIESSFSGKSRPEGIAGFLDDFIKEHVPEQVNFDTLINSRTRDLSDDPFSTLNEFETYCAGTTAPLIQLSLLPITPQKASHAIHDDMIKHAAIAWAATGLVRAIPAHAAQGRCMMPMEILDRYGLTNETFRSNLSRSSSKMVVRDIVAIAEEHLRSTRSLISTIDPVLFPTFLPLGLAGFYLSNIRKSDFNPFHSKVAHPNRAVRVMRLLYASWRKRI